MERLRQTFLVLMALTIAAVIPQRAAASDVNGNEVLVWALVGAGVGALMGLIAVLAQPHPPAAKVESEPETPPMPARPAFEDRNQPLHAETVLDGITLSWLAHPALDPVKVRLRFQRYAPRDALTECRELELRLDGERSIYPLVYTTTPKASIVLENLQAEAGIESLRAMRAARQVEFRLCDVSRTLTPAGADAVARFVTRFDALAAPHSHTAGVTGAPPSAAGAQ